MMNKTRTVYRVWDPNFTSPTTVVILARRGSGKSVLLGRLMYENKSFFDNVYVFGGSLAVLDDYRGRVPPSNLAEGFSETKFTHIMRQAETLTKLAKKNNTKPFQTAVLLDDLGFDTKIFKNKALLASFMNGRHLNLSIFLVVQYLTSIPPTIRSQADKVISLRETSRNTLKKQYDMFFGVFECFRDFVEVLTRATENYGALVLDARSTSAEITECIFTYRCKPATDLQYRLCDDKVWKVEHTKDLLHKKKQIDEKIKIKKSIEEGGLVI
jgi:hypothetical protein